MKVSKITSKYQATIPKEIRNKLQIKAGDAVLFEILTDGTVVLKKAKPLDREYLKSLQNTLNEWEFEYDEQAFEHLQGI